jgi:hypothetical protein
MPYRRGHCVHDKVDVKCPQGSQVFNVRWFSYTFLSGFLAEDAIDKSSRSPNSRDDPLKDFPLLLYGPSPFCSPGRDRHPCTSPLVRNF